MGKKTKTGPRKPRTTAPKDDSKVIRLWYVSFGLYALLHIVWALCVDSGYLGMFLHLGLIFGLIYYYSILQKGHKVLTGVMIAIPFYKAKGMIKEFAMSNYYDFDDTFIGWCMVAGVTAFFLWNCWKLREFNLKVKKA